jgi:hypothetical protein
MATTNATINQAGGALTALNAAAQAQNAAVRGVNVGPNVNKTAGQLENASKNLNKAANNATKLGLPLAANKFKKASNAAMKASIIESVTATTAGLNAVQNAMRTNMNRLNKNQAPTNGAGIA